MATNIRIEYEINDKELKENKALLERVNKEQNLTQKEVEQTNSKFEKQDKQLSKTNKLLSGLSGQLRTTANNINLFGVGLGDLGANAGKAVKGIGGMSKALRIFKIALASTGIGLLVVALGSLVTLFTKTQSGSDKLNKQFERLGAITDVLIGRVANLGSAFVALFSGEFTEALNIAKSAFTDLGSEIQGAISGADKITDLKIKIRQEEIAITKATAERSKLIQDLIFITRDETVSFAERRKALEEANKLELENLNDQVRLAKLKLDLATAELNETPKALQTDEQRLAVAQASAELSTIEAQSKSRQRELLNRINELENKRIASIKQQEAELKRQEESLAKIRSEIDKIKNAIAPIQGKKSFLSSIIPSPEDVSNQLDKVNKRLELGREKADEIEAGLDEKKQQRQEAINKGVDESIEIANRAFENRVNNIQREFEILELTKQAELELAGDNADQRAKIEAKFANQARELKQKEAKSEKQSALFSIAVNTARGIVAALTSVPPNVPLSIAIGVTGAAQGAAVASKPVPKFRQGGQVGGRRHEQGGTLIEAEKGEFILRREAVDKYGLPMLESLNNMNLSPQLFVMNDNKELAKLFKERPENKLIWDENGFQSYTLRKGNIIQKKAKRYSI